MELAVVIVVVALLAVGITSGQSLIEQAELRSVISEFNEYTAAYNSFKLSYGSPPGDIASYQSVAPDPTLCTTDGSLRCNGDGDGIITSDSTNKDESRLALKHLSLAGLIKTPIVLVVPGSNMVPGVSTPASFINDLNGYMFLGYAKDGSWSSGGAPINQSGSLHDVFTDSSGPTASHNVLYLGAVSPAGGTLLGASLTSNSAFSIDKKIDDGAVLSSGYYGASTGKFRALDAENNVDCISLTAGFYSSTNHDTPVCLVGVRMD